MLKLGQVKCMIKNMPEEGFLKWLEEELEKEVGDVGFYITKK